MIAPGHRALDQTAGGGEPGVSLPSRYTRLSIASSRWPVASRRLRGSVCQDRASGDSRWVRARGPPGLSSCRDRVSVGSAWADARKGVPHLDPSQGARRRVEKGQVSGIAKRRAESAGVSGAKENVRRAMCPRKRRRSLGALTCPRRFPMMHPANGTGGSSRARQATGSHPRSSSARDHGPLQCERLACRTVCVTTRVSVHCHSGEEWPSAGGGLTVIPGRNGRQPGEEIGHKSLGRQARVGPTKQPCETS